MLGHAILGASPWDAVTLHSTLHKSWTAFTLSPCERQEPRNSSNPGSQEASGSGPPQMELPLHDHLNDLAAHSRPQERGKLHNAMARLEPTSVHQRERERVPEDGDLFM